MTVKMKTIVLLCIVCVLVQVDAGSKGSGEVIILGGNNKGHGPSLLLKTDGGKKSKGNGNVIILSGHGGHGGHDGHGHDNDGHKGYGHKQSEFIPYPVKVAIPVYVPTHQEHDQDFGGYGGSGGFGGFGGYGEHGGYGGHEGYGVYGGDGGYGVYGGNGGYGGWY